MRRTAFALTLALALTLSARADWPEFRGPTGQGHSDAKNPPTAWAPDANVAWKVAVPGKGWSSPVVATGKVYLTTAVPAGDAHSLRAICLDAKTGEVVWNKEVFQQDGEAPRPHAKNSHASPTPVVSGERLIVHFGHQGTACLSLKDGSAVWRNRTLKYSPVHGNGGSPVVAGGKVFLATDGLDRQEVVALDERTGEVIWRFPRPQKAAKPFSFGTPLLATVAGRSMLICPASGGVNALDPATGKEIWTLEYDGYSVVPRPVVAHGLIFLSSGYEWAQLLAIKVEPAGEKFTAKVAWQTRDSAPHTPSPLVVGDELYIVSDNGIASCRDAKTGKLHWKERVPGQYSSAPLFAGGYVFLQNEAGVGTVLKAGTTFEPVATNKLGEKSLASYAMDGDALLIRTEKHLYRIK